MNNVHNIIPSLISRNMYKAKLKEINGKRLNLSIYHIIIIERATGNTLRGNY